MLTARLLELSCALLVACSAPTQGTPPPEDTSVPRNLRGIGDGSEHTVEATAGLDLQLTEDGWTAFERSPDTRVVYVSSSRGNDAWDGLSPDTPVHSLAAGKARLRHGFPDWMLLRRGDRWDEALGQWKKSGRSPREVMHVGSYGEETERPLILSGTSDGLHSGSYGNSPAHIGYLAFTGLHLRPSAYTGAEGTPAGVAWRLPTTGLLFEDCVFEGYCNNVVIEAVGGRSSDVRVRRSIIVDAFTTGSAHAQGMYLFGIDGLTIEGCLLHHNGWRDKPGAGATIFRHNIYVQNGNRGVRVLGNIIAEAGSHGLQLRPGGEAVDNLFVANPISLMLGSKTADDVQPAVARDNVILDGRDIDENNPRGWGIEVASLPSGRIEGNVIAHREHGAFPFAINLFTGDNPRGLHDLVLRNNVVYGWGGPVLVQGSPPRVDGLVFEDNDLQDEGAELLLHVYEEALLGSLETARNRLHLGARPESSWIRVGGRPMSPTGLVTTLGDRTSKGERARYPAADRTLAGYAETVGLEGGRAGFFAAARAQTRDNWRPELTATAANEWIRAGFRQ
jgi:hypothetical protein